MAKDFIIINGNQIDAQKATHLLGTHIPEWEKAIYSFLVEWWNSKSFVSVKTSGSTGTPKIIKVAKNRMKASAQMTGEYFGFEENQSVLLCLPANFIAGKMMLVRAITWRLKIDAVEPKLQLSIPNKDYYFAAMTPPQIERSLKSVNKIEKILLGGAPVSITLESQLGPLKPSFFVSYGMTETLSHVAIRNIQEDEPNTYLGLSNVSFTHHKENQLVIHAPNLLAEPLPTTDCVELISKNKFRWLGRADFVINSGGLKISPEEIEGQISSIIKKPFFIHGKEGSKWGQVPVLIIETSPFDPSELLEEIQMHTSKNKAPKEVYFLDKFVLTQNGKTKPIGDIQVPKIVNELLREFVSLFNVVFPTRNYILHICW